MTKSKQILLLLLAFVYLPAASLCFVERAGFLQVDDCCSSSSHANSQSEPAASDHTACCLLASPTYKLADDPQGRFGHLVSDFFTPADLVALVAAEDRPPEEVVPISASPPELPGCWQFYFRTALPPRAPSPQA